MVKPGFFDSKYDGLSSNERMRQYERDKMIYEQNEAINESNRLAELRIEQENRNAEMLREQQERNMEIMQQRYEEEQKRYAEEQEIREMEKQEQDNRDRYEKMAKRLGVGLDYRDICEFMDDLYKITYDQKERLREAEIKYDKIFYTEDILNDLKMCEDLKYKIQPTTDEYDDEMYPDEEITVKRVKHLFWRNYNEWGWFRESN